METKTIYISGKISGDPFYKDKFKRAKEQLLNDPKVNWIVINPAELPEGFTYEQYMRIDNALLKECDAIFMLRDWYESPGAGKEFLLANRLCKDIIYQELFEHQAAQRVIAEMERREQYGNKK